MLSKVIWLSHRDLSNPASGGAERTIYEVGRRLAARGVSIAHITGGWHGASRIEDHDGITVQRYGYRVLPHLILPLALREHRDADLIIDDMSHAAPWFTPWMTSVPGIVHFWHLHARTIHGTVSPFLEGALRALEQLYPVIYRYRPFVTASMASKVDLVNLGIAPDRVTIIPPGVDSELFKPSSLDGTPRMVYFGGMRAYKRPEHALYVLARLLGEFPRLRLTIIGSGPLLARIRQLSHEMALDPHIDYLNKLFGSPLAEAVGNAWVNLHCSESEGWCLSAMEAASCGVPTVGYRIPGLTESVLSNQTGLLVTNGNLAELANAVRTVILNPLPWRATCRSHAKQFSWEACAQAWYGFMQRVASGAPTDETV